MVGVDSRSRRRPRRTGRNCGATPVFIGRTLSVGVDSRSRSRPRRAGRNSGALYGRGSQLESE